MTEKLDLSTKRVFWTGAGLMTIWPVAAVIIQPWNEATWNVVYFTGLFFLLFNDQFDQLTELLADLPLVWSETVGWGITILLVLMWPVILCLPFLGRWNRHPKALWFAQFSYAAAQAICGYFYAKDYF